MKQSNEFCTVVRSYTNKYFDALENNDFNSAWKCTNEFADYKVSNVLDIKKLDVNSMMFFAAYNSMFKDDPDINEYVAKNIFEAEKVNLHMFSAFLAKSGAIANLDYEWVYSLINMLCDKEEQELGYCFELQNLKLIAKLLKIYEDECRAIIDETGEIEKFMQAKEMQRKIEKAIHTSALKKAHYLGFTLVK